MTDKRVFPITRFFALTFLVLMQISTIGSAQAYENAAAVSDDPDLAEVQRQEAQMRANIEKLNRSNPYYKPPVVQQVAPVGAGQAIPPVANPFGNIQTNPVIEKMSGLLGNPAVQKYMQFFSDPALMANAEKIAKHPNKQLLFFAEAGLFLLFMIFRAWCASKFKNWFIALIVRIFTNVAYIAIGSLVVPLVVLGEPYQALLNSFLQLFFKG